MKNFSLKTKESSRRSSKIGGVVRVIMVTLAVLLCLTLFGKFFGNVISFFTTPIYFATHWLKESTAPLPSYIRGRTELLDEIQALKEELAARSGTDATIARLAAENEELKTLFSMSEPGRIASSIIARPPYLPYDVLLIDQGESDGVREGAVVFYANDQAIGFVSRVFSRSALVTLYSANGAEATAYVFGPNIYAEMYGEGGGIIRLSIPQGIVINKGDPVVLPGLGMGIVGVVSEVRSVPTEPEQQAYVAFNIPVQALHTVSVSARSIEPVTFEEAEKLIKEWQYHALQIDIPEIIPGTTFGTTTAHSSTTP